MVQLVLFDDPSCGHTWQLRESARARRLSAKVFADGRVEIVVPRSTTPRAVEAFVSRHGEWIARRREAARRAAPPPEPFPPQQVVLAASGEALRVHLSGAPRRAGQARVRGGLLEVSGHLKDGEHLRRVLRTWLIRHAQDHLGVRLAEVAGECGFDYTRLTVRRQRSRWGSCSVRGTISLNCCLMFQRPEVVRYLLVHELAHTRHMHHGVRFWQCVARFCPEYRALDRELLAGWRKVPRWVFGEGAP